LTDLNKAKRYALQQVEARIRESVPDSEKSNVRLYEKEGRKREKEVDEKELEMVFLSGRLTDCSLYVEEMLFNGTVELMVQFVINIERTDQ
jgi:hypothetical protein